MPQRLTAITVIVLLTVVVSSAAILLANPAQVQFLAGFIPARLSMNVVFPAGMLAVPVWLTPLSATLVHAGFFHLGMNMLMLGFTGRETEKVLGPVGLVILYLVGAYAACLGQWLAGPTSNVPMVGASGAASAVVGAYALFFGRSRAKAIGPIPAQAVHVIWLGVAWTGVNLMMGVAFQTQGVTIAAAAHIGGFFAGLVLAKPLLRWHWRHA